ncbi:MAG: FkbM family methyltransferase [Polyangiaceae bacterium]|nr:FkbM family methyltransferase [Polyangiaceae bacterium]
MPDHEIVQLVDETKVVVRRSLDLITTYVLKEQLDWFEDEVRFVRKLCRPGTNVIDIGANYGVYALGLARRIGPNGKLWAFEPAKETAAFLRASVEANALSNLEVVEMGLSNREGTARFFTQENAELNSLQAVGGGGRVETIVLSTLDVLHKKMSWEGISFVKLDAEGEEERILEGGKAFLSASDPLVMSELKHGAAVNVALVSWFRRFGWATYRLLPGLEVLVPFAPEESPDPFQLNLFACSLARAKQLEVEGLLVQRACAPDELPSQKREVIALLQYPYARGQEQEWLETRRNAKTGRLELETGIARYAQAHDESLSLSVRVGALQAAFVSIEQAVCAEESSGRLFSLARVAMELGRRVVAAQILEAIVQGVDAGETLTLDEPYLSPNPRFETLEVPGDVRRLMLAAAIEQLEKLASFSSYYWGQRVSPD